MLQDFKTDCNTETKFGNVNEKETKTEVSVIKISVSITTESRDRPGCEPFEL
jgi:hypothetical protein